MKYIVRSVWALLILAFAFCVFIVPQAIITCLRMLTPDRREALYWFNRLFKFWAFSAMLFVRYGISYEEHLRKKIEIDSNETVKMEF